jgi:hypothetical protein
VKHIIPTEPSETFRENPNMFQSPRNLEIRFSDNPNKYGKLTSYSIFGWNEKTEARVEYQGPMVTGPYASMSANGVMITAHRQEPKDQMVVSVDDTLEIDGVEYSIRLDRYGYVKLTPVA